MHYLIGSENIPIKAETIRARIGLRSRDLDGVIDAAIAMIADNLESRLRVGFSRQVWAIRREGLADFFRDVRFRKNLVSIGPGHRLREDGAIYHDCTYGPDQRHIEALIGAVCAWAMRQDDILDQLARESHSPALAA